MNFHILTLFPEMFEGPFSESILKKAQEKGIISISIYNLRDWGIGRHKQVDDSPYGGGAGMVLKVDVVNLALQDIKSKIIQLRSKSFSGQELPKSEDCSLKTILLTPQGKRLNQKKVKELAESEITDLILLCGHYEGFDERIRDLVDEEISVGDYILTGGEIPAMVMVDSISRLIPGVLGKEESFVTETFEEEIECASKTDGKKKMIKLFEYPQYTRPEEYEGKKVPEVLLSGDHKKIEEWRKEEALRKTLKRNNIDG